MKRHSKIVAALLMTVALMGALLTGCGKEASTEGITANIAVLKGPTAMGMVKLMKDSEAEDFSGPDYNFTIAASADEITPLLVKGELDMAAVPANLASILYNNTEGDIEVIAVNTLGVLYIVENGESINSVADLAGKTIYSSGKGASPEYALNYILTANGLDPATDVNIEWKSEHTECLSALLEDEEGIALLPQPFVTTALTKSESLRVALDLNDEWDEAAKASESSSSLITGVVVARKEYVEEHPEVVKEFLKSYKESVDYVNSNVEEAASLIGDYGIVTAEVAKVALPECNIVCITGAEMKEKLSGYLQCLYDQNPAAVGGVLPADEFYFVK